MENIHNPLLISGQCAKLLALIREHGPILSLVLTAEYAIPETATRVHEQREMGFIIQMRILSNVRFCHRERRNVAEFAGVACTESGV